MEIGALVTAGGHPIVGIIAVYPRGAIWFKVFWCDGKKSWENPSTVVLYTYRGDK